MPGPAEYGWEDYISTPNNEASKNLNLLKIVGTQMQSDFDKIDTDNDDLASLPEIMDYAKANPHDGKAQVMSSFAQSHFKWATEFNDDTVHRRYGADTLNSLGISKTDLSAMLSLTNGQTKSYIDQKSWENGVTVGLTFAVLGGIMLAKPLGVTRALLGTTLAGTALFGIGGYSYTQYTLNERLNNRMKDIGKLDFSMVK